MTKRTVLGALAGALGLSSSAKAQPATVDPRTILYSLPTISNDGPPLTPVTAAPGANDVSFHEDDWRQIEFFPADRRDEIQRTLQELKAFEAQNRVQSGWRNIYVRNVAPAPIYSGNDAVSSLAQDLNASIEPAPLIFQGANTLTGRVRDGFTLRLGPGAVLYGVNDAEGITVLGANLQNADDRLLTDAFVKLSYRDGLVLVDWVAQALLIDVAPGDHVTIWRP
ncbi:hypothetical protein [Terricaulis sp.]|uniref:hypothetical protein n=1 Tax=Terricaulis sp. TaxID=2768686 RepID=UPI0037833B60